MLYEENQTDPQMPKVTPGRAVWRLGAFSGGQGQPLDHVLQATVDIPDAKLSLTLSLRRNSDQTLLASHVVELAFTTPPGDSGRAIKDVGLLQFKNDELVRGTPVSGLPVPVKQNNFLIGLSNLVSDLDRNTDLIRTRNWIDLPIRFSTGERAILSFEKGVSGARFVSEAFRQRTSAEFNVIGSGKCVSRDLSQAEESDGEMGLNEDDVMFEIQEDIRAAKEAVADRRFRCRPSSRCPVLSRLGKRPRQPGHRKWSEPHPDSSPSPTTCKCRCDSAPLFSWRRCLLIRGGKRARTGHSRRSPLCAHRG